MTSMRVGEWGFTPDQVTLDLHVYRDCGQYVFISSASAYQKPPPTTW